MCGDKISSPASKAPMEQIVIISIMLKSDKLHEASLEITNIIIMVYCSTQGTQDLKHSYKEGTVRSVFLPYKC